MGTEHGFTDVCERHLEEALAIDDPSEKDYHIRQVLQACHIDDFRTEPNRRNE